MKAKRELERNRKTKKNMKYMKSRKKYKEMDDN